MSTLILLSQFEQQYSVSTAEITSKIGQLASAISSEHVSSTNEILKLLSNVEDLLDQMELTVWELDSSSPDRSKYELRVKSYRKDKKQLDSELQKAISRLKSDSDRTELFGLNDEIGINQQDQLIANTERLERTSRKIHDSYRMTIETEQIGSEVLSNLSQQRDILTRARDRMREANFDLNKSNKIISDMIQKIIQNRFILLFVAIVLLFSFSFLIYKII